MTSINAAAAIVPCKLHDVTMPPTPGIVRAMAFDRASKVATFSPNPPMGGRSNPVDPAYIELNNVEAGTTFELINLAKKPDADFECDAIQLAPTGRDVAGRFAAITLSQKQMADLDIKPGDEFQIRAKDATGNVSQSVNGKFEHASWANGRVLDIDGAGGNFWAGGTQFSALDGEDENGRAVRKNIIARVVSDTRPAIVAEKNLKFSADENGAVSLHCDHALAPGGTFSVQNSRTGQNFVGRIGLDRALTIALNSVVAGDPIIITPADSNGNAGKEIRLTYAPAFKDGKAPVVSSLMSRLPGVL
jgi:hypothetical protein